MGHKISVVNCTYTSGFDEGHERGAFDFDRLTSIVVQRQHEVEEVALAKVARWMFLELSSSDRYAAPSYYNRNLYSWKLHRILT